MSRTWDNSAAGQVENRGILDAPLAPSDQLAASPAGRGGTLSRYGTLAARILLSQIFLISGVMKIVNWSGTEAEMAGRGMFLVPFFHVAATVVELGAGLSLLLGYKARLGALVLFLYLIPVTATFHLAFWTYPPEQQRVQMLFLLHNLALLGALLLVITCGPGPISLDGGRRRSP
jgi:putative oxidoreductase